MVIKKLQISLDQKKLVDINLSIERSLALVGESGSGKSLTLKALLNMLPSTMLCQLEIEADFELTAGKALSFVPQNPFTALSPLTKIEKQFFTPHAKMVTLLESVGLEAAHAKRYPPELSGGQLQRVIIAMALANMPKLLLLDEPTTALDPTTRLLILELLTKLQNEFGFKILFVTHDIMAASKLCEAISVIKEGKIVESGIASSIIHNPKEPYTKKLIKSNFANREFRK